MALIIRGLSKRFGAVTALHDVDLWLRDGVVALLGANGSGKSTLLRILATLSRPDGGTIRLGDLHYPTDQRLLRMRIGYLPQDCDLPGSLTPRKLVSYLAELRGGQVEPVLNHLALGSLVDRPLQQLSMGQQRLVGVAQALLGSPRLLLLDELTRGLDFIERDQVFRAVLQPHRLILFSTHLPEEAERFAQTVVILHQGHVLFCGSPEALCAQFTGRVYEIDAAPDTIPQVSDACLISRVLPRDSRVTLRIVGNPPVPLARPVAPTLEDAYLALVGEQ